MRALNGVTALTSKVETVGHGAVKDVYMNSELPSLHIILPLTEYSWPVVSGNILPLASISIHETLSALYSSIASPL
jgi:hypothetical protein